jgi:hypothetical protein
VKWLRGFGADASTPDHHLSVPEAVLRDLDAAVPRLDRMDTERGLDRLHVEPGEMTGVLARLSADDRPPLPPVLKRATHDELDRFCHELLVRHARVEADDPSRRRRCEKPVCFRPTRTGRTTSALRAPSLLGSPGCPPVDADTEPAGRETACAKPYGLRSPFRLHPRTRIRLRVQLPVARCCGFTAVVLYPCKLPFFKPQFEMGAGNTSHIPTAGAASPIPLDLLRLLSAGLVELVELTEVRPPRAPYPVSWQRALNQLAAECLGRGLCPPGDLTAALRLCRRPLHEWEVRFESTREFDACTLLDAAIDEPTEFCRELAEGLAGDGAEAELNERCMARLRERAEGTSAQEGYVFLRRYLIEHAVVSERDRVFDSFREELAGLGEVLQSFYEPVPEHCVQQGRVLRCGHCGWTITEQYGRLHCGDPRCRLLTRDFSRGTLAQSVRDQPGLQRVRRAIRRYVVAPGRYEVRLWEQLQSLGVAVELWPGFDRYDLRITLPADRGSSEEVWGVDLKDWRFPRLLASRLRLPDREGPVPWDRFFFVIPNERDREHARYLSTLRELTADRGFEVLRVSDLLRRVRARLRRRGTADGGLA